MKATLYITWISKYHCLLWIVIVLHLPHFVELWLLHNIVSWEPEGRYCSSKMFRWEPEGRYCCIKSMAIAPFWFSMEHLWTAIAPFWLSTDDIYLYDIYLRMLGWKQTKTKTIININFRLSKDKSIVNCECILFLHCILYLLNTVIFIYLAYFYPVGKNRDVYEN